MRRALREPHHRVRRLDCRPLATFPRSRRVANSGALVRTRHPARFRTIVVSIPSCDASEQGKGGRSPLFPWPHFPLKRCGRCMSAAAQNRRVCRPALLRPVLVPGRPARAIVPPIVAAPRPHSRSRAAGSPARLARRQIAPRVAAGIASAPRPRAGAGAWCGLHAACGVSSMPPRILCAPPCRCAAHKPRRSAVGLAEPCWLPPTHLRLSAINQKPTALLAIARGDGSAQEAPAGRGTRETPGQKRGPHTIPRAPTDAPPLRGNPRA